MAILGMLFSLTTAAVVGSEVGSVAATAGGGTGGGSGLEGALDEEGAGFDESVKLFFWRFPGKHIQKIEG